MTTYTFDASIVSDLHKDARGFRPSTGWWESWDYQDDDGKQAVWNSLLRELEETISEEKARELRAVEDFNVRVQKMLEVGARDEQQAYKWIVDSLGPDRHSLMYGGSWVCFTLGLPYSMEGLFAAACSELLRGMGDEE